MTWVDFECPKCNYPDEIQLVDIKTEKTVFCHNCKIMIQLKDGEASMYSAISSMSNGINKINDIFKKMSK